MIPCASQALETLYPPMTSTERYFRAAKDAGCPPDQIENFLKAGIVLQARQLLFVAAARECDRRCSTCASLIQENRDPIVNCPLCGPTEIGFGGARGGGKSHVALAQAFADDCARQPGLKFLYLRKVGKTGKEAIQDLRREVLHSIPHDYRTQDNLLVRHDNGSKIILGHFQAEKDIDNYLGIQYDGAIIEESTQLTSAKIKNILTCIRTSKPNWRPRVYFTANPGGLGHAWFKARFISPLRTNTERSTRFIQSTVRDNRFVNPEYRSNLEALTGWQRKAWLEGDWDLSAGQYFTNWRREIHVVPKFQVPPHWRFWLGFDYGFSHYTACYLMALDGDGNLFVLDEHAERGWLPEQHAAGIRSMLARHGLRQDAAIREHGRDDLETIAAGWDCFNKDRRGKSTADDYEALGLTLSRADVDRINGASEILRRLGASDATPPLPAKMFISELCEQLIDCIPSLQRDPDRGEDVLKVDTDDDGLGGDDFYDALRYGAMHAAVDLNIREGGNPFAGVRF